MLHAHLRLPDAQGCSTEQLKTLARSIEEKKQRLEADIDAYIKQKQQELELYQQEVDIACLRVSETLMKLIWLAASTIP